MLRLIQALLLLSLAVCMIAEGTDNRVVRTPTQSIWDSERDEKSAEIPAQI